MSEFFYDIVIKTIMTIMEIIQERGVDITVHRLMDNNMVLFALYRHYKMEPISSHSVK